MLTKRRRISADHYAFIARRLEADPSTTHAARGQIKIHYSGEPIFKRGISGFETDLDALKGFYTFSREQLRGLSG